MRLMTSGCTVGLLVVNRFSLPFGLGVIGAIRRFDLEV